MKSEPSRTELIKSVLELNPSINKKDLEELTGKTQALINKWLKGTEQPDDMSLALIEMGLAYAHGVVPRELTRVFNVNKKRAIAWGKNNFTGKAEVTRVGEKVVAGRVHNYLYNKKLTSLREISKITSIPYQSLITLVNREDLKTGDSITRLCREHIAYKPEKRG